MHITPLLPNNSTGLKCLKLCLRILGGCVSLMLLIGCASALETQPTATDHTLPLTNARIIAVPTMLRPSETPVSTPASSPQAQPLHPTSAAITTLTPITAVRWKTYTLQRYDYSIQFPSAWNIDEPDHDA